MPEEAIVYIVDDDSSVRTALARLLRSAGLRCQAFPSADEFLRAERETGPQCLVLDLRLPGTNGSGAAAAARRRGTADPDHLPLGPRRHSGHGQRDEGGRIGVSDEAGPGPRAARGHQEGSRIRPRDATYADRRRAAARAGYDDLTPREREVMQLVVSGLLNKQVAAELGISEKTVKVHRAQVMHKMRAGFARRARSHGGPRACRRATVVTVSD